MVSFEISGSHEGITHIDTEISLDFVKMRVLLKANASLYQGLSSASRWLGCCCLAFVDTLFRWRSRSSIKVHRIKIQ